MKRSLDFSSSWYTITDMNISSFKTFALKPRKLANTFWLWGVLYPCLIFVMFFIIVFSAYMLNFYDSSGEIDFSIFIFFITLVTIEAFFALFLTFRASKSIGTCILQLLVLIFFLILFYYIFLLIVMSMWA